MMRKFILLITAFTFLAWSGVMAQGSLRGSSKEVARVVNEYVSQQIALLQPIKVVSISTRSRNTEVVIAMTENLSYMTIEPNDIKKLTLLIRNMLPKEYSEKDIVIYSGNKQLDEWVTILEGRKKYRGSAHLAVHDRAWVRNTSRPYDIEGGLDGRHIALWGSHGLFFDSKVGVWQFQRPSLFGTSEDVFTSSFVIPLLAPMLENAGSVVTMPRERDFGTEEIIVDNDRPITHTFSIKGDHKKAKKDLGGFGFFSDKLTDKMNPFAMGTHISMLAKSSSDTKCTITWVPKFRRKGEYAVYVSYQTNEHSVTDAHYTVNHLGGKTNFQVNQRMGGGTWVYLGSFLFGEGNDERNSVELTNESKTSKGVITGDAVKFGGGWGNVERGAPINGGAAHEVSGFSRAMEGARYWLQWAGVPDSVYSVSGGEDDYKDDINARPRWINYLSGGSKINPKQKGLKVPIDLSLAFHTDAGTVKTDSIIGTLGIYSLKDGKFASGVSTMLSRDLTESVQTQIVDDIRALHEPNWQSRGMWNKRYAEVRIQEVPAMLLELLSHQNLYDMSWGLNPDFRFTAARAVYKGILKYMSAVTGVPYVVQPLPVKAMQSEFTQQGGIRIRWSPTVDRLETTAKASQYIVYQRINQNGWNNGSVVNDTTFVNNEIKNDSIYSYKVRAINAGGESFDSEVVTACRVSNAKGVALIVNGFTRLDAPLYFSIDTVQGGMLQQKESGVNRGTDYWFMGYTREFDKSIPFINNDNSGFGASDMNYLGQGVHGNTFDFSIVHGEAFRTLGYSFTSTSELAFSGINVQHYDIVDLFYGKQKESDRGSYKILPQATLFKLNDYLTRGGRLLLSGATVIQESVKNNDERSKFVSNVLKTSLRCAYSTATGKVKGGAGGFVLSNLLTLPMAIDAAPYPLENLDAIEPLGVAKRMLTYTDGNRGAAVGYRNTYSSCVLAFPFEAVGDEKLRVELLSEILRFLEGK